MKNLWHSVDHYIEHIPNEIQSWFLYSGSTTQWLREHTKNRVTFDCWDQRWLLPLAEESDYLKISHDETAFIRKIDFSLSKKYLNTCRAIIPMKTLKNGGEILLTVGHRPIGEILFKDPHLQRTHLEVAKVSATHPYFQQACHCSSTLPEYLWARRSQLIYRDNPLAIIEIFLPAMQEAFYESSIIQYHK